MFDECFYDSDCDCPAECYTEKMVKAAKEHRCCECYSTIKKGDKHQIAKGKWDGDWSEYRTCLTCVRVRTSLFHGGFIFGEMWSRISDQYCKEPGDKEAMLPESWLKTQ